MDDVNHHKKSMKMGATSNVNLARLTILQERKKQIEDALIKRNQELRQLCIQEAELTGITPPEMPLEPGEDSLPLIRRRVKTAFELPENLVVNANKDTVITNLELQIQLHTNLAEAALGLANEQNISKTMKRQHRAEYQKHKGQCIVLQEKLALIRDKAVAEQHKHKKKPRIPEQKDDNISVHTNFNDPFFKSDLRHSVRSTKQNFLSSNESCVDPKYLHLISKHGYKNANIYFVEKQAKQEDILNSGFYRLSLNGYNKYMERREKVSNVHPVSSCNIHSNSLSYNLTQNSIYQRNQQHNPHYQQSGPHVSQHSPLMSHNIHSSQYSSCTSQHTSLVTQQSNCLSQHSPHVSQHGNQVPYQRSTVFNLLNYNTDINKFIVGSNHFSNTNICSKQSSPPLPQKCQYFTSHTIHCQPSYRHYQNEGTYRNPHQIQPHQQYEHMGIMSMGLGGCWKKSECGELVWYNSNTMDTIDTRWQKDKRFGSLDRRKNKKVYKRMSPSIDHNLSNSNCSDQLNNSTVKSQISNRRMQDNGQLIRTQSLGSVGIQTIDKVYQSDDNSSCESDSRSISDVNQILRKQKEKEWLETSLDGPILPSSNSSTSLQPVNSLVLAPEEKYVMHSQSSSIIPLSTLKPPLEIPAESNPSPRLSEKNLEFFNNVPKNCTIVQAGLCKPYHEETKPFEMSDFYKYSTKFKKSPTKGEQENMVNKTHNAGNIHKNLHETFEECPQEMYSTSVKCQLYNCSNNSMGHLDNSDNLNTSLDIDHLTVSDHFSEEMNAWYRDQQNNNNNTGNAKGRSTATLV